MATEIALVARAKALATRLLARETLETLAEADDLDTFAHDLSRHGATLDPLGHSPDAFSIERAVAQTANRHLRTLYRWQERMPGVLDVFTAHQDRRSLRALLRGAAQGAPSEVRLQGLLPTPSLPRLALIELAHRASPADVVAHLVIVAHQDVARLLPLVQKTQVDLFGVERALLFGFAERATRAVAAADETAREFVSTLIDVGNVQNALLISGRPRDIDPAGIFVAGGRWLSAQAFVSAASADSAQRALTMLTTVFSRSPLAGLLPVTASDNAHLDRAFLVSALQRLTHAARLNPLSTASLLRVLLLIEAQSRDLRTLAWGAALATPVFIRKQQLVTPR
jgi:vacuolar-type H+-ATPase subunit C/Vma6